MIPAEYTHAQCFAPGHDCFLKAGYKETEVGKEVEKKGKSLGRKLRGVFSDWSDKLAKDIQLRLVALGKVSSSDREVARAITDSLNTEGFSVDIVDELSPALKKMFRRAGGKAVRQVGFKETKDITKQLDEKALKYAETRGAELVKGLTRTTRADLRDMIASGLEAGASPSALADSVGQLFAFSEARSNVIARTELAFSHVQGNVEGWRETGVVEKKEWILGDLHSIDDECDQNADAGEVDFDDPFPSGDKWPPAHPNCICDVLPVLSREAA